MSDLLNQVKDIHEAHMGKRSIESVMKEVLDPLVDAGAAVAKERGDYPDPDSVTGFVETVCKSDIVNFMRRKIDWKSWLVITLDGKNIAGKNQEGVYNYVNSVIDEALWDACWTEEFDAKRYIKHLCEQRGYIGEPGMSQQEEDDLAYDRMRAGNFET